MRDLERPPRGVPAGDCFDDFFFFEDDDFPPAFFVLPAFFLDPEDGGFFFLDELDFLLPFDALLDRLALELLNLSLLPFPPFFPLLLLPPLRLDGVGGFRDEPRGGRALPLRLGAPLKSKSMIDRGVPAAAAPSGR